MRAKALVFVEVEGAPYGRLPLEVPGAERGEAQPVRFESAGNLT
jgi:hypothetical protein